MKHITIIVRYKKGVRKVCIRVFSSHAPQFVNANDGRNIDRTADIATEFHKDKEGLNTYFNNKEESIRRDYREDSNSGAVDGVQASELHTWQENRDNLLDDLREQRDDVFDLASVTDSDSESGSESVSESGSESVSGNNNISPNDSNASESSHINTGTSNVNTMESNSNNSSYFPQDSSEVKQTDYSSFEPFED